MMSSTVSLPDTPRQIQAQKKDSLSPKNSRKLQRDDLANLNNRLACYIDRVRTLEIENNRLAQELKSSQENLIREVSCVKALYEKELSDARKLLDEQAHEKAKIQIDTSRLFAENEELKSILQKKDVEVSKLSSELSSVDSNLNDVTNKLNASQVDKKKLKDLHKMLLEEKNKLAGDLAIARKELEEEILLRVDVENSLQTAKEEFSFKEQLLKQQLNTAQEEKDKPETGAKLHQEYEERLYIGLQELREQYEADLEESKEALKKMYEDKLKSLENHLSRNNSVSSMAVDQLHSVQSKVDKLAHRIHELEKERNIAEKNAREWEEKFNSLRNEYLSEYKIHEEEMKKMRDEMACQSKEYEELMDVKIALDIEIAAFRKLIEGEEARFNITPVGSPGDFSSRRILKGKRRHEESPEFDSSFSLNTTLTGSVTVADVSNDGKYIKISNTTNDDILMGKWHLVQKVGDRSVTYEFKRNFKLKAGASCTVWSANQDHISEGTDCIYMKDQKWLTGDHMSIYLLNTSEVEVANAELSKVTSTTSFRSRGKRPASSSLSTTLPDEKCSIM